MKTRFVPLAALAVAVLVLGSRPVGAVHDADLTDLEFKCEFKTENASWKFFAKRTACVVACQRDARAAAQPPNDCAPPFAGNTQGCVNGAHGKAQGGICKACNADTPECYPQVQNCPDLADAELAPVEMASDDVLGEIYCDDSGSGDGLTAAEGACQDATGRVLAKFGAKKAKCLSKCHRLEHKGVTAPGSCPNDSLGKTPACIAKITSAYAAKIDKVCSPVNGGEAPECQGGKTGAQWVQEVEDEVDDLDPDYFCGSPSGAFLD